MKEPLLVEFVTLDDVLELHREMINTIGGSHGIKDMGGVESAVAQPQMTFGSEDIYHTLTDGNKRVGHAAMSLFLDLNGYRLTGSLEEHEEIILALAASKIGREQFTEWVQGHVEQIAL